VTERWRLTQSLQVHSLRPYLRGQVPRCYSLSDPWTENKGKKNNSAVEICILPVEIASLQCKTEPLGYTGHRVLGSDAGFRSSPQHREVPGFPYISPLKPQRPIKVNHASYHRHDGKPDSQKVCKPGKPPNTDPSRGKLGQCEYFRRANPTVC
jgi:hypothetical protein